MLALGILVSYVISALVFLPMEAPLPKDVKAPSYFAELMENIMLFFCSGAFWSCVGLTFATLTSSKYMAYASPFVLYYVLIILYERYFDALYVLYFNANVRWTFARPRLDGDDTIVQSTPISCCPPGGRTNPLCRPLGGFSFFTKHPKA